MESIEERLNENNLDRVKNKGEKLSSHAYGKDRTVQYKKRKGTPPNIASPAKMNTSDAELSDDTSPIEKEEGVGDRKYDKNKRYDEDKEPVFPYGTSSVEMEGDVIDGKDESKKYIWREKRMNALMTLPFLKLRKV